MRREGGGGVRWEGEVDGGMKGEEKGMRVEVRTKGGRWWLEWV